MVVTSRTGSFAHGCTPVAALHIRAVGTTTTQFVCALPTCTTFTTSIPSIRPTITCTVGTTTTPTTNSLRRVGIVTISSDVGEASHRGRCRRRRRRATAPPPAPASATSNGRRVRAPCRRRCSHVSSKCVCSRRRSSSAAAVPPNEITCCALLALECGGNSLKSIHVTMTKTNRNLPIAKRKRKPLCLVLSPG